MRQAMNRLLYVGRCANPASDKQGKTLYIPGCSSSILNWVCASSPGDTVLIADGNKHGNFTFNRPVRIYPSKGRGIQYYNEFKAI
jgi:hypothetical protein